ncbi:ABC transporter ATP-binding protein [Ilumatobacter sp.]|uniref:ABC transporter ATP-binding protein n=1 Tax=Ilumatobacter sp. TaxID=1967498 RepID=UPI003AF539E0
MKASHVFVESVGKSFGTRTALVDVTLLAQGGITAVLGPNGCGKSTLLRCVATVMEPDTGTVAIDGLDPRREPERIEARRRLGYAPQEAGFDARLRVFDAVDYVGVLKGLDDTRRRRRSVFEALDRVGLAERVGERVGDLSGGMRRRLVLSQTLLGSPTLLVLDEPGAGLDPDERLRLREVLAERRRTTTVLLATHLTDEAAGVDTVIVLGAGRVLFAGGPARLAAHAAGRVWLQTGFPPPGVRATWQQADGRHRCLGHPPPDAELVEPTLEEGYLIVQELVAGVA